MAITPADLAKLTPIEQQAFTEAARMVADGWTPYLTTIVTLIETIERLITEPAELIAEGPGPLLDPDCRDGKCGSCTGAPCEHECHRDRRLMRPVLLEPRGELNGQLLKRVLELVGVDVTVTAAERWTKLERLLAYDWAMRERLAASDNLTRRRERPSFLSNP